MKKINIIKFVVTLLALLFVTGTAAADRVRVFELAESGYRIEFPMTPAEIESEKSRDAVVTASGRKNDTKPKEYVKVFEMGEGGHTITFSMTAAETATEIAAKARLEAIRAAKVVKPKPRVDVFELAESGITFEFPMIAAKTAVADSVISGSDVENGDIGT